MIITLKGADFSGAGNNIGNLSQIGGTFTFTINPTPSDATVKINGTAQKSITGAYGTAISWEVSKDGYNTRTGSLTMPLGGKTMSVSLTAVGSVTPPVDPEEPGTGGGSTPSVPTTTTWYVDHRNNGSLLTTAVNIAGRGWCHEVNTPAYNAYVGKPVNTVSFFTKLASQQVTVMVGATNSSEENCRLIGTYTATNPNGTSKGLATITFPTVTLNQGEHLILFAQTDANIDFYYASKAVTDANGIVDSGFHGRVPKVYGTGTAWQKMSQSGTYSLAWSIGYVI